MITCRKFINKSAVANGETLPITRANTGDWWDVKNLCPVLHNATHIMRAITVANFMILFEASRFLTPSCRGEQSRGKREKERKLLGHRVKFAIERRARVSMRVGASMHKIIRARHSNEFLKQTWSGFVRPE